VWAGASLFLREEDMDNLRFIETQVRERLAEGEARRRQSQQAVARLMEAMV
jgi:hypothetical protein